MLGRGANWGQTRFDQPEYVKRLHENANVLLGHWHEYARRLGVSWASRGAVNESLAFLRQDSGENMSREVVLNFYHAAQQSGKGTRNPWKRKL